MTAKEASKAIEALKKRKPAIVCSGYGTCHGWKHGRLWFVCSKCRWKVAQ